MRDEHRRSAHLRDGGFERRYPGSSLWPVPVILLDTLPVRMLPLPNGLPMLWSGVGPPRHNQDWRSSHGEFARPPLDRDHEASNVLTTLPLWRSANEYTPFGRKARAHARTDRSAIGANMKARAASTLM
jgi:hypothetical protein